MPAPEPDNLVQRYLRCYNMHDAAGVTALFAADGTHGDAAMPGRERTGFEAVRNGLQRFFDAFPDSHWEPRSIARGSDVAAIEYTLTGTHAGPMGSMPPTGKRISLPGVQVLTIREGLITRCTDYWDAKSFERQLREESGI